MLNRIEAKIDDLIGKLGLGRRKLHEFMLPGEVFITNARSGRSEAERDMPKDSLFRVHTAFEQVEWYKDRYDSVRIIPKAFNIYGQPAPMFEAIVGIPKPTPPQTA